MDKKDIRWKQRFQNFEKSLSQLNEYVQLDKLSVLEKAGIIQLYEVTFELAWKTLKDYLNEKNVDSKFPRDVIKDSFSFELIDDGDLWLDMLEKRNIMSHTYNERLSNIAIELIKKDYVIALNKLHKTFESKKHE